MDDLINQSSMIKAEARRLGFSGCGISRSDILYTDAKRLEQWLQAKHHGSMAYMQNHADKRADPAKLVDGAKSVVSVILNYFPATIQEDPDAPVISKYAYGEDYHEVIRKKLRLLLHYVNVSITPAQGRAFADSAPVLDRAWAARSGLGWIGKNTNLISPETGSFFFIGSLIIDIPLHYDSPINEFCGDCNRCISACPTGAILEPYVLDARKCISYLTIENKGDIGPEFRDKFRNRVFGCDICQDVCPWNRKSTPHQVKEFEALPRLMMLKRQDWLEMDEAAFNELFPKSAVKRAKFSGLRRNIDFIK